MTPDFPWLRAPNGSGSPRVRQKNGKPPKTRALLAKMLPHYHLERPHQGLGNRTLSGADPPQALALTSGEIECQERVGGLVKHYRRRAA
jgi:hypothetical protein